MRIASALGVCLVAGLAVVPAAAILHGHGSPSVPAVTQSQPILSAPAPPPVAASGAPQSRGRPTRPMTLRGVAVQVANSHFVLRTRTKGAFNVILLPATRFDRKGVAAPAGLQSSDHVGVRGLVNGGQIRALTVRLYPTKPKPYSLVGQVASLFQSTLAVHTVDGTVRARVSAATHVRVGNRPGVLNNIAPGQRVRLRLVSGVQGAAVLSVHVFVTQKSAKRVRMRGSLAAVSSTEIVVRSGGAQTPFRLASSTIVSAGTRRAGPAALHAGQTVTVSACCAGRMLIAIRVHILRTHAAVHVTLFRGTLQRIMTTSLILRGGSSVAVRTDAHTHYLRAGSPIVRSSLRVGEAMSVRARRSGRMWLALAVRVLRSGQTARLVRGAVAAVQPGSLEVQDTAGRVAVQITSATQVTLDGHPVAASALRVGDHVRVRGVPADQGLLRALTVTARRPATRLQTVRGTLTNVHGTVLVVSTGMGRVLVRVPHGVFVMFHGQTVEPADLFAGMRITARGQRTGGTLAAAKVTASAISRHLRGTVLARQGSSLTLESRGGTVQVVMWSRGQIVDGSRPVVRPSLNPGSMVAIAGYSAAGGAVLAVRIEILHPSLHLSGTLLAVVPVLRLETAAGTVYSVRFNGEIALSGVRVPLSLGIADVPTGVRARVTGVLGSDGVVDASALAVHLRSLEERGQVGIAGTTALDVHVPGGTVHALIEPFTRIVQGSHVLTAADVVMGDDVSLHGYVGAGGRLFTRRVDVHRPRVSLDGTVSALLPDGFTLQATDGDHHVLTHPYLADPGAYQVGETLHVSGYLRGDAAVLATHVRTGRTRQSLARRSMEPEHQRGAPLEWARSNGRQRLPTSDWRTRVSSAFAGSSSIRPFCARCVPR